jgi:hypothetical protein
MIFCRGSKPNRSQTQKHYAEFTKDLTLARNAKAIKLGVRYWGARGTAFFDDLSLLALDEAALSTPDAAEPLRGF